MVTYSTTLEDYKSGLRTFLELCEKCFGPKGQPVLLSSHDGKKTVLTKDSLAIFRLVESTSNNPLVKTAINFSLEQSLLYGDHGLYVVIVALNAFFRLSNETIPVSQIIRELNEMETIIDRQMSRESGFHSLFESNFELLVQLSINLINPKLFGFASSKLESFSKFVIAALIQSMPDASLTNPRNWFEPKVLLVPTVSWDPYNYGELYEGFLFPIENEEKMKKYLQRVILLRSFNTYEILYKEKTKLNSILMNYDNLKFSEMIFEQIIFNEKYSLPSLEQSVREIMENNFIGVLEKGNIGVLLCQNELSWSLKCKLSEISIFVLDSIGKESTEHISRVFDVEIVTSLSIEDVEGYIFQIELPTIRSFDSHPYIAVEQSGVVVLIFYILLDGASNIDEKLAKFIFKIVSKLIFMFNITNKRTKKMNMLCHGGGCTEMLLAGMILRIGDTERSSASFWLSKTTQINNVVKQSIANALIKIWQLIHDFGENQKLFDEACGPLNFCRNNASCVCGGSSQVLDITGIKCNAIKKAIQLLNILLKIDSIILT